MAEPSINPAAGTYVSSVDVSLGWTPGQVMTSDSEDPDLWYKMDGASLALNTTDDGDAAIEELEARVGGASPDDAPQGTWRALFDGPNWRDHIKIVTDQDLDPDDGKPLVRHPGHKGFVSHIWYNRKADYDLWTESGGTGKPRADMNTPAGSVYGMMQEGEEYWAGHSIRMPLDWEWDLGTWQRTQVVELHGIGQNTGSLEVHIGEWRFKRNLLLSPSDMTKIGEDFQTTPCVRGEWADFVWHVKMSRGSDGFVRVWKDGDLLAETFGFNMVDADISPGGVPFSHAKIYKGRWYKYPTSVTRDAPLWLCHAEFRIIHTTDAAKGLAAVDPSVRRT